MGWHTYCEVSTDGNKPWVLYMAEHLGARLWAVCAAGSSCDANTQSVATCGPKHADNWQWSSNALRCGAQRLGAQELRAALGGKWVVIAGDSISRYFYAAFLRLLSADSMSLSPVHALPGQLLFADQFPKETTVHSLTLHGVPQSHRRWCTATATLSTCCRARSAQRLFGRPTQTI